MISLLVGTEEPLILDDDSEYHTVLCRGNRPRSGRLMNTQASRFRAACREQAGLAIVAFGRLWSRYAPGGRNRILLRTGCLIFAPFITLTMWFLQGGRLA